MLETRDAGIVVHGWVDLLAPGAPENIRTLSIRDLVKRLGLSRTTIWRLSREPHFPPSYQISAGHKAWLEPDINHWLGSRMKVKPEGNDKWVR